MKYRIISVLLLLVLAQTVWAGTRVVGMELGVTTLEQARSAISRYAGVSDVEPYHFTRGKRFTTSGPILGVTGLQEALFVFDSDDKLAGVVLTLDKGQFERVAEILSKKYKEDRLEERPLDGDRIRVYRTEDATIELTTSLISLSMDAVYIQTDIYEKLKSKAASDEERRRDIEARQF